MNFIKGHGYIDVSLIAVNFGVLLAFASNVIC